MCFPSLSSVGHRSLPLAATGADSSVLGLLVPYNDPNLGISTGTAEQSPFVIAFQRAGIKVLPSIINAVVCTSAFSCGSSCVFLASRTLYGLAEEGQAPRFFLETNRFGTPWLAVAASLIFMPLVYLSLGSSSSVVFGWCKSVSKPLLGNMLIASSRQHHHHCRLDWLGSHMCDIPPFLLRSPPPTHQPRSSAVQEPTATIRCLDNAVRAVPRHSVLRIQRFFPGSMEYIKLLDVLH